MEYSKPGVPVAWEEALVLADDTARQLPFHEEFQLIQK